MQSATSRRAFLKTVGVAGAAAGLGDWGKLGALSPASATDAGVTPDLVRFHPELEPLVRLIEITPRAQCPAMMIEKLRDGLPFRNFLAALFLVNLRNGGMHHPLLVLHSTNQLTLDAPVQERLLPTFWAMDSFKFHQERGRQRPEFPELKGALPGPGEALEKLHAAMAAQDADEAERALVALIRTQGAGRVLEPLWHYGARDWSMIGHRAIGTSNTARLLETIGWQHAEHGLRMVIRSLISNDKTLAGQPFAANTERVARALPTLPAGWAQSGANAAVTAELLDLIREVKTDELCETALRHLSEGKSEAGAVWDAIHLAAGEIILNKPTDGGTSLHSNTGSNALHYSFQVSAEPATRLLILLQALGWMCLYRRDTVQYSVRKGHLATARKLTDLAGEPVADSPEAASAEILSARRSDTERAVRMAFTFAQRFPESHALRRQAGRLLPLKASWDPHDVKFPIAMFEKYTWVNAQWRPHILAASVFAMKASDDPDMPVAHQVREALRTL